MMEGVGSRAGAKFDRTLIIRLDTASQSTLTGGLTESNGNSLRSIHNGCIESPIVGPSIPVGREGSVLCGFGGGSAKDGLSSAPTLLVFDKDSRNRLEYHLESRSCQPSPPFLEVVITSAMPSELTGFELSKLDLLERKSRSLPPCFHEVTVAPKRLSSAVFEWKRSVRRLLSPGLKVKKQILTRSLRWIPNHQQLTTSRLADPTLC